MYNVNKQFIATQQASLLAIEGCGNRSVELQQREHANL